MTKKNKEIKKKGREETHPPLRDESNRDEVPHLFLSQGAGAPLPKEVRNPSPRRTGGFHIKNKVLPDLHF